MVTPNKLVPIEQAMVKVFGEGRHAASFETKPAASPHGRAWEGAAAMIAQLL
jgi:hypothetical protein